MLDDYRGRHYGAKMNWFAVALVGLQSLAGLWYMVNGSCSYGILWLLYALANVVLINMEMLGK